MRARRFRSRAVLVALALALPAAAGSGGATAATVATDWVENQLAGPAIEGFNVHTVLYNGMRFPTANGQTQRPLKKYLAYGTYDPLNNNVLVGVAMSDDGVHWGSVQPVTLNQGPFFEVHKDSNLAVAYGPAAEEPIQGNDSDTIQMQFAIVFVPDLAASATAISGLSLATSIDGINFVADRALEGSTVTGTTRGASQLILNPNPASNCTSADATYPFNCRAAILFDVNENTIAMAGSDNALSFEDRVNILGLGGAGAWDDNRIGNPSVEVRPHLLNPSQKAYHLSYTGAQAGGRSSAGVAVSVDPDGAGPLAPNPKVYAKAASNPVTPISLLDTATGSSNLNIDGPTAVLTENNAWYSTVDPSGAGNFYAARRVAEPGVGPKLQVLAPQPGPLHAHVFDIEVCMSDTKGTNIGINPSSFALTLDGSPVTGYVVQASLQCAIRNMAFTVRVPNALTSLAVGDHQLAATVKDNDGNTANALVDFSVDRSPPNTILTVPGQTPQIDVPLSSIGYFEGETTDGDSAILGMRAIVTNPLGQSQNYEARFVAGQISKPANGFTFLTTESDGKKLTWRWTAPTLDPHTAIPGPYTLSFVGIDMHNAVELPDSQNTTQILFI